MFSKFRKVDDARKVDESDVDDPEPCTPPKKKLKKSSKRYCVFKDEWLKTYEEWIRKYDDCTAECTLCRQTFTIKFEGIRAINTHVASNKHVIRQKEKKQSKAMSQFLVNKNSTEDDLVTVSEITSTYHGVMHHVSYNAQDCGNKLIPKLVPDSKIALKMSCGRTKAASIVENVLAPKSEEILLEEVKQSVYFAVSSDASNKKNVKYFPLTVRYFHKEEGVKHGLVDFYNDSNESSLAISQKILEILEERNLSIQNVSSYCADNASVNYGKHNSVFQKLQAENKTLFKANCKCHILNNCMKNAVKALQFDVETFIIKVYNEFSSSAKRVELLKTFFDFVDLEYQELLRHVPTRWLSLYPALERLLNNWAAIKSYFLSEGESECGKLIWQGIKYEDDVSIPLCTLHFIHDISKLFHQITLSLESNNVMSVELHEIMTKLRTQIASRQTDKYFGVAANKIMRNLLPREKQALEAKFDAFFCRALTYLEKLYDYDDNILADLSCLSLTNNEIGPWAKLEKLNNRLNIEIDENELYNDFSVVRDGLSPDGAIKFCDAVSVDKKWAVIFKRGELPELFKLVAYCLSIPVSNAYCERVFSLMNMLWNKERNRLSDSQVKAELQVRLNYHMTCSEFCDFTKKCPEMIKAAKSQNKYRFKP